LQWRFLWTALSTASALLDEEPMTATDNPPMRSGPGQSRPALTLGQFTEPRLLVPRLLSTGQENVIQELAKHLEAAGRIANASAFTEAVAGRELDLPTFVGDSVAVPHGRGAAIRVLSLAVGLSAHGIPWGRDRRLVARVIFLFAIPLAESPTYLALLSGLSALLQDNAAFEALQTATQPEHLLRALNGVRLIRMGRAGSCATGHGSTLVGRGA
jgi:fructose PTS system EIIA component